MAVRIENRQNQETLASQVVLDPLSGALTRINDYRGAGFAVGKRDIHAVEITETRLVLKHVHLDFIDALEDDRDRDDEHYEARRAARRPRRDRRDRRDPRDQRGR